MSNKYSDNLAGKFAALHVKKRSAIDCGRQAVQTPETKSCSSQEQRTDKKIS